MKLEIKCECKKVSVMDSFAKVMESVEAYKKLCDEAGIAYE